MRFPYETKVLRGLRGEQGPWDDERRFIAEADDSKFDGTKFVQEAAAVQECAPSLLPRGVVLRLYDLT